MAELKTKPTDQSVAAFLDAIPDERKRRDAQAIADLLREVTGVEPQMWGDSIVGFGRYRYQYASGREGEWFVTGFSPRKQNLTVYIMGGLEQHADLLQRLGKHKIGKGCLYINRLADIDMGTLRELVAQSVANLTRPDGQ